MKVQGRSVVLHVEREGREEEGAKWIASPQLLNLLYRSMHTHPIMCKSAAFHQVNVPTAALPPKGTEE